ncbi:hypothetical protein BH09ACT10_BH09ACT10_03900 [soil metagenome]
MDAFDLLGTYGRNEPCWCGSMRKYKRCHGNDRPPSTPGAPLPPDRDGSLYLSPSTAVTIEALSSFLPAGTPITIPSQEPAPSAVTFSNWEQDLTTASVDVDALTPLNLGALRVEVLRKLASLPETDDSPSDNVIAGVYELTVATVRTVAHLAGLQPRLTILWDEELDPGHFLGRTLLLADHVLCPDGVFAELLRQRSQRDLRDAAQRQLRNAELLGGGVVIPVPPGVAMAASSRAVLDSTAKDLKNAELVTWVRQQLIVEGPTAREALFVRAQDDLNPDPTDFWLRGRIDRDSLDENTGSFGTTMLSAYDPNDDYGPWIRQVETSAVSKFVQRTNERVITADVFGSEYVSASLFEARLLRRRSQIERLGPSQAALWADIPELPILSGRDLVKVLKHEGAVEDLRRQVRAALVTARTDAENVDAITDLAHELEAASHKLLRTAQTDRAWQGAIPTGLGTASMFIGGITGGLAGLGVGALGALGTLAPQLGTRLTNRRDAAYLFVVARRRRN